MKKTTTKLSCLLIVCALSLAAMQVVAQGPDINSFFGSLKNKVIAGADQLTQWKNAAEAAARKTVSDFTDCPSPAAQNLYNDLKNKLNQAREVKRQAEEADNQAQAARDRCKQQFPAFKPQCDTAYNGLSFKATAAAAAGTIASLEAAINAMKNLKCASGCNRNGKVLYPLFQTATVAGTMAAVGPIGTTAIVGGATLAATATNTGTKMEFSYCSTWKPGKFEANFDSGGGQFDARVRGQLPSCQETKNLSCCKEWDMALVLPKLKSLNLIPPDVSVSDITISIPDKTVTHISGVKGANCSQSVKLCKRSSVTLNLNASSNPLTATTSGCQEWVDIGCASPAFGLEPITTTTTVPDITKVKISWKGVKVNSGQVVVDMTRAELRGTCKTGCTIGINVPPDPIASVGNQILEWVCLDPRFVSVVANQ
jgi:hypothetical protein